MDLEQKIRLAFADGIKVGCASGAMAAVAVIIVILIVLGWTS